MILESESVQIIEYLNKLNILDCIQKDTYGNWQVLGMMGMTTNKNLLKALEEFVSKYNR